METKDSNWRGHLGLASAEAENDDSDEGKDGDGGNIEAEAPGGQLAVQCRIGKWLKRRSYKEEEEKKVEKEEGRDEWQQNADSATKSSCLGSIPKWPVS